MAGKNITYKVIGFLRQGPRDKYPPKIVEELQDGFAVHRYTGYDYETYLSLYPMKGGKLKPSSVPYEPKKISIHETVRGVLKVETWTKQKETPSYARQQKDEVYEEIGKTSSPQLYHKNETKSRGEVKKLYFPDLFRKNCKCCGKEIYPTPEWVYRRDNRFYCGWNCYCRDAPPSPEERRAWCEKPVEQIDPLSGAVIAVYDCARVAAKALGFQAEGIRKCCRGDTQKYLGFVWAYKEDKNHD